METILSVMFWGGMFFLMMKFGCGSHMFGHGSKHKKESAGGGHGGGCGKGTTKHVPASVDSQSLRWEAPEKDSDPVCGETVSTAAAKSSVHGGLVYYFCSHQCREAFEARPGHYVGQGDPKKIRSPDHIRAEGETHDRELSDH